MNDLGYIGFEKCMIRLTRNDYELDICYFNKVKSIDFEDDQMFYPAPNFVVEVLSSNETHDRVTKFTDYQEHGILENEVYDLKLKAKEGKINSLAVDGFSILIAAVFDKRENLKALHTLVTD